MKSFKAMSLALAFVIGVAGSAVAAGNTSGTDSGNSQGAANSSGDKSSTTTQDPNTPEVSNRVPQGDACSSADPVSNTTKCAPAPGAKQ
jgi:hypothetical protein